MKHILYVSHTVLSLTFLGVMRQNLNDLVRILILLHTHPNLFILHFVISSHACVFEVLYHSNHHALHDTLPREELMCLSIILLFEFWGGGVESILGPLGTAATTGLLYLPRGIVRMEKLVE
jgi:hypothetical protein